MYYLIIKFQLFLTYMCAKLNVLFSCIENDLLETAKVKIGREEERALTAVMSKCCFSHFHIV